MPQFDPNVVMLDQLARQVTQLVIGTTVQCFIYAAFIFGGYLIYKAIR